MLNIGAKFILLNVNVFGLGYHYDIKDVDNLFASTCMLVIIIASVLLSVGWLTVNIKIRYLCHKVAENMFCG